jgi:hypothetical protein
MLIHRISIVCPPYLSISVVYLQDMEIRLKLRKIGNSMVISIPAQVIEDLGLKAGDEMLLDVEGTTIKVRKREKSK